MRTILGRLRGVSPALDGAFIEVIDLEELRAFSCTAHESWEVVRFGGMPVAPKSIFISPSCIELLSPIPAPDELETGNSYGKFIESDQWVDATGVLSVSVYENCVHLNLRRGVLVEDTVVWKSRDPSGPDVIAVTLAEVLEYKETGREVVDFLFRMRELKKGRD